jgi:serine/threonine protein kinase
MKECQHCKKCYTDDVSVCPSDGMPTLHTISGEPVLEGKYHLEKRLGQGGMGVVYCAKHSYLKTQHAIKVILPDLVGNDPQ